MVVVKVLLVLATKRKAVETVESLPNYATKIQPVG